MSENKIVSRQAAFMIFILILGSAITYMPESTAGRDAWVSTLMAAPLGIYILWLIISIQNMFPGMNMLDISEVVLGKLLGKILNVFYICLLFTVAVFYLYDLAIFLDMLLFDLQRYVTYAILILAAAYCIYKGVNAVARLIELMVGLIPFFLALAFLALVASRSNFSYLLPVLADWRPVLAGSLYAANWPFVQVSILIMYLPFVSDLAEKGRTIYAWYLIGALILVVRSVVTISVLGVKLSNSSRFPFYEAFTLLKWSNFERVELLFFGVIFLSSFLGLLLGYQGLVMGVQKLLVRDDMRYLILPVGLLLVILTTYMFPSDIEIFCREVRVLPFITLPVHIFYPSIIFGAAKFYQKRNAAPKTAAR